MIPLVHDFRGERVLVFGGATRLRGAPDPGEVGEWIDRVDPALVVAATDDTTVNAALEDAATERGLLVNRADRSGERDPGSVVMPATARDDPVVVAIATGGRAPVLSGFLREDVETLIEGTGALADLLGDLRDELEERAVPTRKRRRALRAVVEDATVREALREGDRERAREEAVGIVEEFGA